MHSPFYCLCIDLRDITDAYLIASINCCYSTFVLIQTLYDESVYWFLHVDMRASFSDLDLLLRSKEHHKAKTEKMDSMGVLLVYLEKNFVWLWDAEPRSCTTFYDLLFCFRDIFLFILIMSHLIICSCFSKGLPLCSVNCVYCFSFLLVDCRKEFTFHLEKDSSFLFASHEKSWKPIKWWVCSSILMWKCKSVAPPKKKDKKEGFSCTLWKWVLWKFAW